MSQRNQQSGERLFCRQLGVESDPILPSGLVGRGGPRRVARCATGRASSLKRPESCRTGGRGGRASQNSSSQGERRRKRGRRRGHDGRMARRRRRFSLPLSAPRLTMMHTTAFVLRLGAQRVWRRYFPTSVTRCHWCRQYTWTSTKPHAVEVLVAVVT